MKPAFPTCLALLTCAVALAATPAARAQRAGEAARAEAPASLQYQRLAQALERYGNLAAAGGWPAVPDGPTIEPGSTGPRIEALSERLAATGDLDPGRAGSDEYDAAMQAAVRAFQERHGLEPDGRVGRRTLAALNVPVERRVEQLRLNLRRTQALIANAPERFLLINIPAFEAYLVRDGHRAWKTKVIVGETKKETPPLETRIDYVVLNPTWTVPRSIATEELLSRIQADPGFLERGGYDVVDGAGRAVDSESIDWPALHEDDFPYVLVQRAGASNELGRVKFMLSNADGVCMHDTASPYLFEYASRAYSHGCIRMDKPMDLAEQLLEPLGWTREAIDAQLESGRTRTIPLGEPLPVIVTYLTAAIDDSGRTRFYPDVYGRDDIRTNPDSEAVSGALRSDS